MSDKVLPFPGPAADSRWWSVRMAAEKRAEIHLRGTIGASKVYNDYGFDAAGTAREFEQELRALGDDVSEITLYVASLGGGVWDALMIHDVLARHPAKVTAIIDGIAASAASFIVLAADEIEMPANSYFMIHNAQGGAYGDHRTMLDIAEKLEQWSNDIAKMYARRIGDTGEAKMAELRALMDKETWLTGEEALAMGLIDRVTGAVEIAACIGDAAQFSGLTRDRMPEPVRAAFDKARTAMSNPLNPTNEAAAATEAPAATETPVVAEAAATETPAPADAPEAAPAAPAVINQAAPAPAAETPAAPDFAALIKNALTDVMKPIEDRLALIENRAAKTAAGVKPWPAAQAAENVATGEAAENVINFTGADPMAMIALGRNKIQANLRQSRQA